MKHTVVESLTWLATARLLAQLVRWGASLVLANLLTPLDYNIVVQAEIALGFIELFTSLGLAGAIIRNKNITEAELRSIFGAVLLIDAFLSLCLYGAATLLSTASAQPELLPVMQVQAMVFLVSAFEIIPNAMLMKQMRFKSIAIIQIMSGVIGALTSTVLAYQGVGYWAIVLGGVSMQITRVIAANILQPTFILPSFKFGLVTDHIRFGGIFMSANIIWYLYINLDIYIAGIFWDDETLGYYAFALLIAAMPLNKIIPTLKQVALPAYSRAQDDRAVSAQYLMKSLRLCMGVGFPLFAGLAAITPLLVTVILSEKWLPSVPAMTLLMLLMPFRMFLELQQPAVAVSHRPGLILTNAILILAVMLPTFFVASQFNPTVLAAAWLGIFPLLTIFASHQFCKALGLSIANIIKSILPALVTSLVMFAVVRVGMRALTPLVPDWLNLILAILLGAAFYLPVLYLIDRNALKEYITLIRR